MRIYTVTCNDRPVAVVRAENHADAVATVREMDLALGGAFAAREPNDAEMVSWLERRANHRLSDEVPLAAAS